MSLSSPSIARFSLLFFRIKKEERPRCPPPPAPLPRPRHCSRCSTRCAPRTRCDRRREKKRRQRRREERRWRERRAPDDDAPSSTSSPQPRLEKKLDRNKKKQDFRYMATSDLQASLAAAPRSPLLPDDNDSPTGAGAVCAAVLARLADPSSDVSALAVKW